METFICDRGCCTIKTKAYIAISAQQQSYNRVYKAGVMIYDPHEDAVLLVQSRGNMWGLPKGSMEAGETFVECAMRETKEETGIELTHRDLTRQINVGSKAVYFYHERPIGNVSLQPDAEGVTNDANGIAWIKMGCLSECVRSGKIALNYQARSVIYRVKGIKYPRVRWTTVRRRSVRPARLRLLRSYDSRLTTFI